MPTPINTEPQNIEANTSCPVEQCEFKTENRYELMKHLLTHLPPAKSGDNAVDTILLDMTKAKPTDHVRMRPALREMHGTRGTNASTSALENEDFFFFNILIGQM